MSCELHREIILLDTGRLSPGDARALELHAADCDVCRETVTRLRAADVVLTDYRPSPGPGARARVWERLSNRKTRALDPMRFLIPAAAAAIAVAAVLIFRTGDEGAAPKSRIEVAEGTRYQMVGDDPERAQLELEQGRVFAAVDRLEDHESFEVITRDARIVGRETSFIVDAGGDSTFIEVESGELVIWPRSGALPVTLGAGRTLKLIAKKVVIAREEPPEPVKDSSEQPERPALPERLEPEPAVRARSAEQQASTLATARSVLADDAPRAAALAAHVLQERPSERLEAEAVAVLADAQRRRGLTREAAELYQRVARHAEGRPFAEEALMQRALLLAELEGPRAALEDLEEAARRFPNGPTAPERTTLSARLHLALGDAAGAAEVIERARVSGVSLSLLETRIAVGRALFDAQPERVRALLAPALDPSAPKEIRQQAVELIQGD